MISSRNIQSAFSKCEQKSQLQISSQLAWSASRCPLHTCQEPSILHLLNSCTQDASRLHSALHLTEHSRGGCQPTVQLVAVRTIVWVCRVSWKQRDMLRCSSTMGKYYQHPECLKVEANLDLCSPVCLCYCFLNLRVCLFDYLQCNNCRSWAGKTSKPPLHQTFQWLRHW